MVVAAGSAPEAVVPQRIRACRHLVVPVDGNRLVRVRILALEVGAGAPVAQVVAARLDGEVVLPPPLAFGLARTTAPTATATAAAAPAPTATAAAAPASAVAGGAGARQGAPGGGRP